MNKTKMPTLNYILVGRDRQNFHNKYIILKIIIDKEQKKKLEQVRKMGGSVP